MNSIFLLLQFDLFSEYGPLNNITYEERLYRAYFLGKFTIKEGKNDEANLRYVRQLRTLIRGSCVSGSGSIKIVTESY